MVITEIQERLNVVNIKNKNSFYATLAFLTPFKEYLYRLIMSKKVNKTKVYEILPLLLKLLSKNDEYFLMILYSKYLFNKNFIKSLEIKEETDI